jgi:hypothetical protein
LDKKSKKETGRQTFEVIGVTEERRDFSIIPKTIIYCSWKEATTLPLLINEGVKEY